MAWPGAEAESIEIGLIFHVVTPSGLRGIYM